MLAVVKLLGMSRELVMLVAMEFLCAGVKRPGVVARSSSVSGGRFFRQSSACLLLGTSLTMCEGLKDRRMSRNSCTPMSNNRVQEL